MKYAKLRQLAEDARREVERQKELNERQKELNITTARNAAPWQKKQCAVQVRIDRLLALQTRNQLEYMRHAHITAKRQIAQRIVEALLDVDLLKFDVTTDEATGDTLITGKLSVVP